MFVLTGGGPAGTTETLTVYAYRASSRRCSSGFGSAIGVVVFALVMLVAVAYLRLIDRAERDRMRARPAPRRRWCWPRWRSTRGPFFWQVLTSVRPDAELLATRPLLPAAHHGALRAVVPRAAPDAARAANSLGDRAAQRRCSRWRSGFAGRLRARAAAGAGQRR